MPPEVHPDTYYEDVSREAIAEALEEVEGETDLDLVRYVLRRSCPFERKGPKYKIWNRLVSEAEAMLNIASRVHYDKTTGKPKAKPKVLPEALPETAEEFERLNPRPETLEQASHFLRTHTRAILVMMPDHDVFRVTLKQANVHDHALKLDYSTELRSDAKAEWERVYLEAAQEIYTHWLRIELRKF